MIRVRGNHLSKISFHGVHVPNAKQLIQQLARSYEQYNIAPTNLITLTTPRTCNSIQPLNVFIHLQKLALDGSTVNDIEVSQLLVHLQQLTHLSIRYNKKITGSFIFNIIICTFMKIVNNYRNNELYNKIMKVLNVHNEIINNNNIYSSMANIMIKNNHSILRHDDKQIAILPFNALEYLDLRGTQLNRLHHIFPLVFENGTNTPSPTSVASAGVVQPQPIVVANTVIPNLLNGIFSNIKMLDISCGLTSKDEFRTNILQILIDALMVDSKHCLRALNLSGRRKIGDFSSLSRLMLLEHLNLTGTMFSDDDARRVFPSLTKLCTLELGMPRQKGRRGSKLISNITMQQLVHLRHHLIRLQVKYAPLVTSEGIMEGLCCGSGNSNDATLTMNMTVAAAIQEKLPLQELQLSFTSVDDRCLLPIVQMCPNLRVLGLMHTHIMSPLPSNNTCSNRRNSDDTNNAIINTTNSNATLTTTIFDGSGISCILKLKHLHTLAVAGCGRGQGKESRKISSYVFDQLLQRPNFYFISPISSPSDYTCNSSNDNVYYVSDCGSSYHWRH